LLEDAGGIGDMPMDLQTPIFSPSELLVRNDFKVDDPDWLTLRYGGLREDNNEQSKNKQVARKIKKPSRISHWLVVSRLNYNT
jgi:hypothetical protein